LTHKARNTTRDQIKTHCHTCVEAASNHFSTQQHQINENRAQKYHFWNEHSDDIQPVSEVGVIFETYQQSEQHLHDAHNHS
jgi:hypothetical protein